MQLKAWNSNVLITVGALEFKDSSIHAFINTFNHVEDDAWIVFNVKDNFFRKMM
jgi:hypothetical protein